MSQTEELFHGACDAKVKLLQVFEVATSIENLDFLVFQLSSVTAVLGGNFFSTVSVLGYFSRITQDVVRGTRWLCLRIRGL
jgi:hypothetical protein